MASPTEFVVVGKKVLLPGLSEPEPATLHIRDGRFVKIERGVNSRGAAVVIDTGSLIVMAGIVDTHAHINEPGRTDWEGFETATRAAAAGGITTVVDMPLNSIPATTSVDALKAKAKAAEGRCRIDYGLWGGVIPGNSKELEPMVKMGVPGFKAFMIESGVDEFPHVTEKDLREAMPVLARLKKPLLVHAEVDCGANPASADEKSYHRYVETRPPKWEVEAIRRVIKLSRETGCRVHIVHLSASDALEDLHKVRADGVPVTVETCPHYLTFCEEEIPDGATYFKCAPPIRDRKNRDRLWKGLKDEDIDFIVSDHSPCTPQLKKLESGDFEKAWGGIAGLQFSLPATWTEMKSRGLKLSHLTQWMSERTANFADLRKGQLREGWDADFVIWNPEESFKVDAAHTYHRHSLTPYAGRSYFGLVQQTFVRGIKVFDNGTFPGPTIGRWVKPGDS